jgi:hypothetical protein
LSNVELYSAAALAALKSTERSRVCITKEDKKNYKLIICLFQKDFKANNSERI